MATLSGELFVDPDDFVAVVHANNELAVGRQELATRPGRKKIRLNTMSEFGFAQ